VHLTVGFFVSILILSALSFAQPKQAGIPSSEQPKELKGVGITERLGQTLDLALIVRNEKGEQVPLSTYFNGKKPVLLSLIYFSCPGLCNFHLNGLTDALKQMDWNVGENFDIIALSFDSKETSDVAVKKKENYLKVYSRTGTENGWHFLTADENTVQKITESVGFQYKWDEQAKEWAHASAAVVMTPEGKIARYLHGIVFEPRDVKLSLIEAADGKIASLKEKLVWFCYKYDPHTSKYAIVASQVMKLGGGLFVLLMAAVLVPFWLRSKKEQARV